MQNSMEEYVIGTVILRLESALEDMKNDNTASSEIKIKYIIDELKRYTNDVANDS